jgi:hypothetical protein
MSSVRAGLLVCGLTLSCSRPPASDPMVASPEPSIAAAPSEPAPEPTFDAPPSPEVIAYLADCSHVVEVPDDVEGNPIDECEALAFDQMCTHDPSGCWEAGRQCESICVSPCGGCQSECAGTCDACKAACAPGAEGCLRACAERRASCRSGCMTSRDECLSGCPDQERDCNEEFTAKVTERCPDCDAIGDCLIQHEEYGEEHPACSKQFPRVDELCFEWCYPS